MNNLITVGIDVAKNFLDVCIMPSGEVLRVPNTKYGFNKLLRVLLQYKDIFRIVLEHTGGYQKDVVSFLHKHGMPVSVINPARARFFAKSRGQRAKTDAIDAENLALFGSIQKPALTEEEDKESVELRELVHRRGQIIKMMTSEKNRLDKNPCIHIKKSLNHLIKVLGKELEQITGKIQRTIEENTALKRKSEIMRRVKGIGAESSAVLIAEVPELGKVGRQQIASLVGLAPMNRDSGKKKGRAFTQGGRGNARMALYMPTVVAATRVNPVLRSHYERLVLRGKPKKVAITACMRKMLVHLNSLLAKEM
jgi:transposase